MALILRALLCNLLSDPCHNMPNIHGQPFIFDESRRDIATFRITKGIWVISNCTIGIIIAK